MRNRDPQCSEIECQKPWDRANKDRRCREHYNAYKRAQYHATKHLPHMIERINAQYKSEKWFRRKFTWLKNYDGRKSYPSAFDYPYELYKTTICKPCFYCSDDTRVNGLDRVDNSLGHSMQNTIPCCVDCNRARGDRFTHEEFIQLGKIIKDIKFNRLATSLRRLHGFTGNI